MKTTSRFFAFLFLCLGMIPAQGQQQVKKNAAQLGDQYFAAGEYYTAAHLYGQYLNPSKKDQRQTSDFPLNIKGKRTAVANSSASRLDILYKQAESYRLANYWKEASEAYKTCAENDPGQYANATYWYGVCQRNLGQYDSARQSVNQYLTTPGDKIEFKDAAEKELATLSYIQRQITRADSVLFKTEKLNVPNSNEKGAFAPVHIGGNQYLISSTEADSVQISGVNPNHSRLFYALLNGNNLEAMTPVALPAEPAINQGAAAISHDGKYLYISQWKKEKGQVVSAIYYSVKQADGWSKPALVPSINTTGFNSKQPFCSADGKFLYFSSDKPGGSGGFDIWYAPLKEDGTTGEPVNAGTTINTKADEQAPFYQNSSNTLVFSSNGRQGMGGYDLFSAQGNESTWKTPQNIGYPVNSAKDDIYFFASEQSPLLSNAIISSDRSGSCCLETYRITKIAKNRVYTGVLQDCKENTPVADVEVMMQDASGKTWKTKTDADGHYEFETGNITYQDLKITANKELYLETSSALKIDNTDESDLLTDKLSIAAVCIEKKPEEKPVEPEPLVIKAEDIVTVFFDFDRSLLKDEAVFKLDSIYTVLVQNPSATIQISGYTDGLGSQEYNQKLSDKRARACAEYLIKLGIDKNRVTFVSFGACCPVEMELINGRDNPDGRSKNRRALINVKKD